MGHLYVVLSDELKTQIANGVYAAGDRLPGLRTCARMRNVSVATVLAAYEKLEAEGVVEARARSGFFVRSRKPVKVMTGLAKSGPMQPAPVPKQQFIVSMMSRLSRAGTARLGATSPPFDMAPTRALDRSIRKVLTQHRRAAYGYTEVAGSIALRRQIARLMSLQGAQIEPEQVLITSGCQEALSLALSVLTQPGDIVAVESPTYYGLLQILEGLRLNVLEIPCCPQEGIDTQQLQQALQKWPVKACVLIPAYNNPSGFCMSDDRKREVVKLLEHYKVPLVEDDVYGDLGFYDARPHSIKAIAPEADILYCSSFSKTLEPGLRVGWIVAGRYQSHIEHKKLLMNIATPSLPQLALADFLEAGRYARHLAAVCSRYGPSLAAMSDVIMDYFPEGTRISQPQGGFVLWVELRDNIDTYALAEKALKKGISIAPGALFSVTGKFNNYMRLSAAQWADTQVQKALYELAKMLRRANR